MLPAVFLDRDGVIIENRVDYIRTWEDVQILPGGMAALSRLNKTNFKIVIVTNQSAIGRGLITQQIAEDINLRLMAEVKLAGARLDAIYMCPHKPEDCCSCRKPRPGLILQAAHDLSIDLERSFLIGDALDDLRAGRAAGVKEVVLVLTGRGAQQFLSPEADQLKPFLSFNNLADAIDQLLCMLC